jgi:hypothetical protein
VSIFLNLQQVVNGATFDNLNVAIVCFFIHLGGVSGLTKLCVLRPTM